MSSRAAANVFVRAALAVVFGFMSLLHGPIMLSAHAAPAAHAAHHAMDGDAQAAGHHHHGHQQKQATPSVPDAMPSCYGIGCFVVLDPFVVAVTEAASEPIATLWPPRVKAMVPANHDPAVPPPRLHV